jgi:hypothetical protein
MVHLFGAPDVTLDAVTFDASRYRAAGELEGRRVWFTPDGDALALYLFRKKPDLPARIGSAQELRELYARRLPAGARVVEAELVTVDGVPSVWTLLELPQAPQGVTWLASLTVPFADFSFVLKLQCEERGGTAEPDAPVARARRELARLRATLRLDARVRGARRHLEPPG